MITKLDWDSDFFGFTIGKMDGEFVDHYLYGSQQHSLQQFKLLYIFSDHVLTSYQDRIKLVDVKTILAKKIQCLEDVDSENIMEYSGKMNEKLRSLALQAGVFSRFKLDENFTKEDFERLYTKWLEESLRKKIADHLFLYKAAGIVAGFITLKVKDGIAEIGLVAVDANARGRGIGQALLRYANNFAYRKGLRKIEVVTQKQNEPAMGLYAKAGFNINSEKYVYHFWPESDSK